MPVLNHTGPGTSEDPNVPMSDWWVYAHWGRGFNILGRLPRNHNFTRDRDAEA